MDRRDSVSCPGLSILPPSSRTPRARPSHRDQIRRQRLVVWEAMGARQRRTTPATYLVLCLVPRRYLPVQVRHAHEVQTLCCHKKPIPQPRPCNSQCLRQLAPIQPPRLGTQKFTACVRWRLIAQPRENIVGQRARQGTWRQLRQNERLKKDFGTVGVNEPGIRRRAEEVGDVPPQGRVIGDFLLA